MAACLYIVIEGEDPGFDIFVNGHALARNEDQLERIALRLRVSPLLDFFSADVNAMALLQVHGAGHPDWAEHLPQPQWFSASDGLVTVHTLLVYLESNPGALGADNFSVLAELKRYEQVLRKTTERDLRWHLSVSWN